MSENELDSLHHESPVARNLDHHYLELKGGLRRGYDYEILPRKVWMRFKAWYGGGPEIPIKAISTSALGKLIVDLYPLEIIVKIIFGQQDTKSYRYSVHRLQTIIDLKYMITNDLYINPQNFNSIYLITDHKEIKLQKLHYKMTLDELNLHNGSTIIFSDK